MDNQRSTEVQVPSLLRLEKGTIPINSIGKTVRTCYLLASDSFLCASPAPATVWLTASTDMDTNPSVTSVFISSTINFKVNCGLPAKFLMKSLALDVRISASIKIKRISYHVPQFEFFVILLSSRQRKHYDD